MTSSSFLNPTVCEVSYDDEIAAGGREVVAAYTRPRTGGLSPPRARPQVLRDTPSLSFGDYEEYREYVKCIYRDSRPVSQLTYSPRNTPSTPFIGNTQTVLHQPNAWEVGARRERVHTAPCSATRRVPTARTMPGAVRSTPTVPTRVPTSHNINAETFRRPQWIPALNAWVPETKQREKESSYINFVGSVSLLDRGIYHEEPNLDGREPPQPCPRFMTHMTQSMPIGPVNAAKTVKRITSKRSPTIPKTPFTGRRREDLLPKSLTRPPQRFVRQRVPDYGDRQEVNAEDVLLAVPLSPPPSVQDSEVTRDEEEEFRQGSLRDPLYRREELADVESLGHTAGDPEDDGIFSMLSGYRGDVGKSGGSGGSGGAGAGVSSGGSDSGGSEEEGLQVAAGVDSGAGGGMGMTSLGESSSVKGLELLHAVLKNLLGSTSVEDVDTEVLRTTLDKHLEECNTCTHLVRQVVRSQLGPVPDNYLLSGLISILPLLSAGGSARSQLSLHSNHDWSWEGEVEGRERKGMEEEETEEGVSGDGGGGTGEQTGEGSTCGEGQVQGTAGEVQSLKEEDTLKADSTARSKKDRKERRRTSTTSVEATDDKAPKSIMKKTKTQPRRISAPRVTIETEPQSSMSQQTDTDVPTAVEDYPIEEELESVSEVSTIEVPQPKLILDNKGKKKGRDLKSEHACRQKSPKVSAVISLRSPKPRDTTLQDELRRQQLAEERRAKAAQMYEKLRRKPTDRGDEMEEGEDRTLQQDFKDYGFLSKYCIFNKDKLRMYRKAFDAVDEDKDGYLSGPEALMALKGVVYSGSLNDAEEYYVYRILELADYKVTEGADFKLFAVMSALSQRIASLDNFMKDLIRKLDFKSLEYKMFRLKQLFLCNVDPSSNRIPLEHLMLELQAGGVSMAHQNEVRAELAHLDNLDLLDFLAYVPLFTMIHQSVVNNPFDNQWNK
ncbi:Hypp7378 [Branchiostoma lanceolatum]|uniref:Hypp7378 protein n=1 Tax=Branchiostoma lanceolatum TaxID=7740 RepID=A0A8J9YZH3_BRALA|nr:Hypp7378 [Branchiostoma lanceolatum]